MGLVNGFIDHLYTPIATTSNYSAIYTIHTSPQHPLSLFPACYVFNSRSLATVSNSGDSWAFRAHVVTLRRISRNWTLVDCKLDYKALSSQPPLQSSTELPNLNRTHSPTYYFTSLNWTCQLQDNSSARTASKTPFFYCWVRVRFRGMSRCSQMVCITPLFYCCERYLATAAVYSVNA
jgi:hypothetical protein